MRHPVVLLLVAILIRKLNKSGSNPIKVKSILGHTVFELPAGVEVDSDYRYAKAVNGSDMSVWNYD